MEHRQYKTLYSVLSHGTLSISNNTPFGQLTGASAGGRKAWTPLSDGISPTQGADFNGPTAIIKVWIGNAKDTAVSASSFSWATNMLSTIL